MPSCGRLGYCESPRPRIPHPLDPQFYICLLILSIKFESIAEMTLLTLGQDGVPGAGLLDGPEIVVYGTSTPAGVGIDFGSPRDPADGDRVVVSIDRPGTRENFVRQ